jgi:hypothetical protein
VNNVQEAPGTNMFKEQDLVTWHYCKENKSTPVPGVVIRQEADSVLIKARVDGSLKEFHVVPEQLAPR